MVKGSSYAELTCKLGFKSESPLLEEFLDDIKQHHSQPRYKGFKRNDGVHFQNSVCSFLDRYGQKYWPPQAFNRTHLLHDFPHACLENADDADPKFERLKEFLGDLLQYMAQNYLKYHMLTGKSHNALPPQKEVGTQTVTQDSPTARPNLFPRLDRHAQLADKTAFGQPLPNLSEILDARPKRVNKLPEESEDEENDAPLIESAAYRQRQVPRIAPHSNLANLRAKGQQKKLSRKRLRSPEPDGDFIIVGQPSPQSRSQERLAPPKKKFHLDLVMSESEPEVFVKKEKTVESQASPTPNPATLKQKVQSARVECIFRGKIQSKATVLPKAIAENVVLRVFILSRKTEGGTRIKFSKCSEFDTFFAVLVSECEVGESAARVASLTVSYPWDASSSLRMRKGNLDDWEEFCGDIARAFETPLALNSDRRYINIDINV
ncbi:MAG: hypothetical protein M1812_003159 [Candelaria pacifica]|nr:MAG: hypothetical protein M1812_003159 [Candelaria pacifica]